MVTVRIVPARPTSLLIDKTLRKEHLRLSTVFKNLAFWCRPQFSMSFVVELWVSRVSVLRQDAFVERRRECWLRVIALMHWLRVRILCFFDSLALEFPLVENILRWRFTDRILIHRSILLVWGAVHLIRHCFLHQLLFKETLVDSHLRKLLEFLSLGFPDARIFKVWVG